MTTDFCWNLIEIVLADPTLESLTKGASSVSNEQEVCIINKCVWYKISRFSSSTIFVFFHFKDVSGAIFGISW